MLRYCPKLQPACTNSHLPFLYLGHSPIQPLPFTGCHIEGWVPHVKQRGILLTSPTIRHLKNNCCFSPLVIAHLAQVTSSADILLHSLLHTFKIKTPKRMLVIQPPVASSPQHDVPTHLLTALHSPLLRCPLAHSLSLCICKSNIKQVTHMQSNSLTKPEALFPFRNDI